MIFILGNYSKFVYDSTSIQKKDGNGSVSSNSQIKLGVVIIARNEEDAIGTWHRRTQLKVEIEVQMRQNPFFARWFRVLIDIQTGKANKEEIENLRK